MRFTTLPKNFVIQQAGNKLLPVVAANSAHLARMQQQYVQPVQSIQQQVNSVVSPMVDGANASVRSVNQPNLINPSIDPKYSSHSQQQSATMNSNDNSNSSNASSVASGSSTTTTQNGGQILLVQRAGVIASSNSVPRASSAPPAQNQVRLSLIPKHTLTNDNVVDTPQNPIIFPPNSIVSIGPNGEIKIFSKSVYQVVRNKCLIAKKK